MHISLRDHVVDDIMLFGRKPLAIGQMKAGMQYPSTIAREITQ